MYQLLLPLLLLGCCSPALLWGQQLPDEAQLKAKILQTSNDSMKAELYLQLYQKLPKNHGTDSLIVWAKKGSQFAQQHLHTTWGREAYRVSLATIGHTHRRAGKYRLAQQVFQQLIATSQQIQDSTLLSDGYSDLAYVFSEQEKDDSTIYYDLKALAIRKAIQSPKVGSSYNNLGYDYKVTGQLQKGLYYYQKAIQYKIQEKQEKSLGNSYLNVGNIYQQLEQWDSSLYYYNKALNHQQAATDSLFLAETLHNIGRTHLEAGQSTTANNYLEQAMAIFKAVQMQQHPRVVHTYHELARAKLALQQAKQATALLNQAQSILQANDMAISYGMQYNVKLQEEVAWATNNYEQAQLYAEQKALLTDSLHQRELQQKTYQLLTDYEDQLKVERINALEQQQKIDQLEYEKISHQRLILAGVLLLLIIVIVLLYRINQWKSKVNEELSTLNATKDKLFSIIAHDLKNPLSAFRSITQSLADGVFDISREDLDYFIQQLNTSAHSLLELLQNLLYWSISQSGKLEFQPQALSLQTSSQEVFQLLHNSALLKNISLDNQIPPEQEAWADSKMTKAILRNLVANALKFTPNGGKISISSEVVGQKVKIRVQDTGNGVPAELQEHLFSLKTDQKRTQGAGTGLGLILCKELVEHQGGEIWLEESSATGSSFCFTLPLAAA